MNALVDALVDALLDRLKAAESDNREPDDDGRYPVEIIVWATVAVYRTALVRQWELRSAGRPVTPPPSPTSCNGASPN